MEGLLIREPWINLILNGQKTWEMRSKLTRKRGPIALIRRGSGLIVGTATIADCLPPLSQADYMLYADKHAIPASMLSDVITNKWVVPWVLSDVRRLAKPIRYNHPSGAVVFVRLEERTAQAVCEADPGFAQTFG